MKHRFDVIVIGAGHAGCEAAHVVSRMGLTTALVTLSEQDVGALSCNPAIGGIGKGHLVREIDAMGGLIGMAGDAAGIHFRLLNASKGPAVRGPRAQVSRKAYAAVMTRHIRQAPGLHLMTDEVVGLLFDGRCVGGVRLRHEGDVLAKAVVLTTGTFLGATIHIGSRSMPAGRLDGGAVNDLPRNLTNVGVRLGSLKTGTPPRLDGRTIDWTRARWQPGDAEPIFLSASTSGVRQPQMACGITTTNDRTHDLIRRNLHSSAVYGGRIAGDGPRYCPSIEDKVVKFPERPTHQVFLEPECIENDLVYPNGLSTSLDEEIQLKMVRSVSGLEECQVERPGYAVEYQYADPRQLDRSLMVHGWAGLYFAGQINGTTGYEEAAAQGLAAGLNASLAVHGRRPYIFERRTSYIGVLIDDLTRRGVSEPYRMFTSRAENRLAMRPDNAERRLSGHAWDLGCLTQQRWEEVQARQHREDDLRARAEQTRARPADRSLCGVAATNGSFRTMLELMSVPSAGDAAFRQTLRVKGPESEALTAVRAERLYAEYARRDEQARERVHRGRNISIPAGFDYSGVPGLSAELAIKLDRLKPSSLDELEDIEGMTPAGLGALYFALPGGTGRHSPNA